MFCDGEQREEGVKLRTVSELLMDAGNVRENATVRNKYHITVYFLFPEFCASWNHSQGKHTVKPQNGFQVI